MSPPAQISVAGITPSPLCSFRPFLERALTLNRRQEGRRRLPLGHSFARSRLPCFAPSPLQKASAIIASPFARYLLLLAAADFPGRGFDSPGSKSPVSNLEGGRSVPGVARGGVLPIMGAAQKMRGDKKLRALSLVAFGTLQGWARHGRYS